MSMSLICLKKAFRHDSGPLLFLVGICTTLAFLFLGSDSDTSWVFLTAAGSALMAFSFVGARGGCNGTPAKGRLARRR